MRSFVFTLGFHEDFILQRLSRKAAQPGERVPVLTASPVMGWERFQPASGAVWKAGAQHARAGGARLDG
ncbi:MAG: hypothetical protein QXO02_10455 [Thermofilaceae archaeon]